MEFDKRHSYLIQWLIGIGDLAVLNCMFILIYSLLGPYLRFDRVLYNQVRHPSASQAYA